MKTETPPLYLQIAEAIRRRIAADELKPGDKLPPIRQMAQRWNCTPGTVGRAYATLASDGLVVGQRGKGTQVTPNPIQPTTSEWDWAALVNRAERFLLQSIGDGHEPVEIETALSVAIKRWGALQTRRMPERNKAQPQTDDHLRFAGSHDLIVDLLPRILSKQEDQLPLSMNYIGSLGGLMALARDEADLAGSHLWDEATDTYNIPFVRKILPGQEVVLITLAHRLLGLILPRGNPHNIRNLTDLTRPGIRFANRQAGSGTRVWLDAQLKQLGIRSDAIAESDPIQTTHIGVARLVAQGEASVGLGVYSAASSFGLDFIPLTKERYELISYAERWNSQEFQALRATIRSPHLLEAIASLGGYDTSDIGRENRIS